MGTATTQSSDLEAYCRKLAQGAKDGSVGLATCGGAVRAALLAKFASCIESHSKAILAANKQDLARAAQAKMSAAMTDRLRLDAKGIAAMAQAVREVAQQPDPCGQIIEGRVGPNGLRIEKVRVPLGVILMIYESRPNVTADAAALCLKSGNAVILRGGKEASASNAAIAACAGEALAAQGLDPAAVTMVDNQDHQVVGILLGLEGLIDLAIPRGGESLIRAVATQARIPVIKHYSGNCHVYVDKHAPALGEEMVVAVCLNAKVQRPAVCNATETILFHEAAAPLLREVGRGLAKAGVEIRACPLTMKVLKSVVPAAQLKVAQTSDWYAEYLDKIVAVKIVRSLDDAIAHINLYGSHHTDAILTGDLPSSESFVARVDSANVMVNCSTRLSDGSIYGLGAEVGISTDKLHARGPMGAADLTTYKWVVHGQGQVRK